MSSPVAARCNVWVYGRSLAGIEGLNPGGTWTFYSCECCVLSGIGLCDGVITPPQGAYVV